MYDEYTLGHDDAHLANNIGAIMGGFGSIVVIVLIFRYKALRKTTSTRLIFFQTCSYLLEAVCCVVLPSDQPMACTVQAALVEYAMLSSALWACVMIYVLYSILVRSPASRLAYDPNREMLVFYLICWVTPLPLTIAPLITGDYGQVAASNAWCWVREDKSSGAVMRVVHYGFYWLLCIFIAVMSAVVWIKLRKLAAEGGIGKPMNKQNSSSCPQSAPSKASVESVMYNRLIYFPIGQMILFFPISLYRFWKYSGTLPPPWLLVMGIGMARCYGLLNLLVYTLQRPVQVELVADMKRLRSSISGSNSSETPKQDTPAAPNVPNAFRDASTIYGGGHARTTDIDDAEDDDYVDYVIREGGGSQTGSSVRRSTFRVSAGPDASVNSGHRPVSLMHEFRQSMYDLLYIPPVPDDS